jgi:hypothetical protein
MGYARRGSSRKVYTKPGCVGDEFYVPMQPEPPLILGPQKLCQHGGVIEPSRKRRRNGIGSSSERSLPENSSGKKHLLEESK